MTFFLLELKSLLLLFLFSSKAIWPPYALCSRNKMTLLNLRQCKQKHTAQHFSWRVRHILLYSLALSHVLRLPYLLSGSCLNLTCLLLGLWAAIFYPSHPTEHKQELAVNFQSLTDHRMRQKGILQVSRPTGNIVVTHLDLLCNADQRTQPSNFWIKHVTSFGPAVFH